MILKNNIWNYFKKINYDYKEKFREIEEENKQIGYIVRVSEVSRIDYFTSRMKEKNIKQNLPLKNEHSDNNMAILGNKTKKRIQSEDKYRKQLNIDFPSKLVQNIASNVIFPCSIYINNKDNIGFLFILVFIGHKF